MAFPVHAASSAESLLQQAVIKESTDRDLDAAIVLYQSVVSHPKARPAVVAEARYRMAGCYLRLGQPNAAEPLYEKIMENPGDAPADVRQDAQAQLRRLRAQRAAAEAARRAALEARNAEPAVLPPPVVVKKFQDSAVSVAIGPSLLWGPDSAKVAPQVAIRYLVRRSTGSSAAPLAFGLEWGAVPQSVTVQEQKTLSLAGADDSLTSTLRFQTHVALFTEVPHGAQRTVIPEIAGGLSLASMRAEAKVTGPSGQSLWTVRRDHQTINPYFHLALKFFPDARVSASLRASYIAVPAERSFAVPAAGSDAARTLRWSPERSAWATVFLLHIKLGHTVRVVEL